MVSKNIIFLIFGEIMKNDKYRLSRKDIKSREFLIPFIIVLGIGIGGVITDFVLSLNGILVVLMLIEFLTFFGIVLILGSYAKMKNKKLSPKFSRSIVICGLILVAIIYLNLVI